MNARDYVAYGVAVLGALAFYWAYSSYNSAYKSFCPPRFRMPHIAVMLGFLVGIGCIMAEFLPDPIVAIVTSSVSGVLLIVGTLWVLSERKPTEEQSK